MSEVIANLPNTNYNGMSEESFIMTCLLDFNANQGDENTSVAMAIEGLSAVRNKFKKLAIEMADKLDAVIAEHAEEKKAYEQQTAELMEKYEQKCAMYEQVFEELIQKNNAKATANWRNKQSLRNINEQIQKVLAEMSKSGEPDEVILDIISLTGNETEDEIANDGDGDEHDEDDGSTGCGDGEDQKNAEVETPLLDNQAGASAEQNGNDDDDIEMVVRLPAEIDDDTNDKENIQPQSSNENGTAELQSQAAAAAPMAAAAPSIPKVPTDIVFVKPAPVNVPAIAQPNTNAIENGTLTIKVENDQVRMKCFRCEESFIKESSLRNHLKSDHGVIILPEEKKRKKKDNDQHDNEPGKFVRPIQTIKRKRSSVGSCTIAMDENNDDTENRDANRDAAPQPDPKRKYARLVSEPLGRSNPRV